jgi:hypothetical protein
LKELCLVYLFVKKYVTQKGVEKKTHPSLSLEVFWVVQTICVKTSLMDAQNVVYLLYKTCISA